MSDDKPQSSNSLDDIRSRYEMVMIAGVEARRLNELARTNGKELRRRVTEVAWERLQTGKVYFSYQEPVDEDENQPEVQGEMVPDLVEAAKAEGAGGEASAPEASAPKAPAPEASDPEISAPAVEEGA